MKRKLFFWLEKLKITPGERKAVSGLMALLVLLALINAALSPAMPFEEGNYAELEKQFKARTAALRVKEAKLMKRYYPSTPDKQVLTVPMDTVTVDSTEKITDKKREKKAVNNLININTADQQVLESLPGIGPTYAKRIILYREKHGGFSTIGELIKIKGIGEKRLDKLKPFIKLRDSE